MCERYDISYSLNHARYNAFSGSVRNDSRLYLLTRVTLQSTEYSSAVMYSVSNHEDSLLLVGER